MNTGELRTVDHVFLLCCRCQSEREVLHTALHSNKITLGIRKMLQMSSGNVGFRDVFIIFRKPGISKRIESRQV